MFSTFRWPCASLSGLLLVSLLISLPLTAQETRGADQAAHTRLGVSAPPGSWSDKGKPKKGDGPERPKPKPGPRGGDDE